MSGLDRLAARLISLLVILAIVAVALATAFGFLVVGSFMLLAAHLPDWTAALITGGGLLLLAMLAALVFMVSMRSDAGRSSGQGSQSGGGRQDNVERSVAALDRALQGDPWTLVAGSLAAGVILGMNPKARDATIGLLAGLFRPPQS